MQESQASHSTRTPGASVLLFHPSALGTSTFFLRKLRAAPVLPRCLHLLSSYGLHPSHRYLLPVFQSSQYVFLTRSRSCLLPSRSFLWGLGSEGPKREWNAARHEVGCVDRRRRVSTMARPWSMWTAAMALSAMWVCVWTYTHPTDQEALEVFLDGIEEDPRGYLSSWRGSNDACGDKWMGIECNEDGRVTVLNLHYRCDQWRCDRPVSEGGGPNELVGTISPWVGNLTELRRFHASHNRLYGPLPGTIGRLRHVFGT